jgi:DNA-binding NtrC family response regulator
VRIIAATSRDLSDAVAKREFRSYLYYRLHVFPLHLPPLRERHEDIPLLVRYFVQKFSRRMAKKNDALPVDAMETLERWHWPGNIRELENFLERSVILTEGTSLRVRVGELLQPQCGWKSLDSWDSGGIGAAVHPAGFEAGRRDDFRIRRRGSETGHEAHHPSIEDAQAWHIEGGRQLTSPDLPDQNCRPFGNLPSCRHGSCLQSCRFSAVASLVPRHLRL